jgi:hypothetical protein
MTGNIASLRPPRAPAGLPDPAPALPALNEVFPDRAQQAAPDALSKVPLAPETLEVDAAAGRPPPAW